MNFSGAVNEKHIWNEGDESFSPSWNKGRDFPELWKSNDGRDDNKQRWQPAAATMLTKEEDGGADKAR